MDNHELQHYGVLGMKWGVRRSSAQLGGRVDKLRKKNTSLRKEVEEADRSAKVYDKKSLDMQTRNSKYESRIAKATAAKAKYDLKTQKEMSKRHVNSNKVGKYMAKSAKYDTQIKKAQKKLKYNKWAIKSEQTKAYAAKARDRIAKNEKLMNTYNKTIDAIDRGTIEQGRWFMEYVE